MYLFVYTCVFYGVLGSPHIEVVNENMHYLESCIEDIAERSLKPSDIVVYTHVNSNVSVLNFANLPVMRKSYEAYVLEMVQFKEVPIKPNAYVLVLEEDFFEPTIRSMNQNHEWNPKAKFIIYFKGNDVYKLFPLLIKYYIYNAIVLYYNRQEVIYVITYFPYGPPRKVYRVLDKCVNGKLQNGADLYPSRYWGLTTAKLLIHKMPPYITVERNNKKKGFLLELLFLLQEKLKFNLELGMYLGPGYKKDHEDFSAINMLENIDIILTADLAEFFGFERSFPCFEDSIHWVVPIAPLHIKWNRLPKIFEYLIWICLIICLVITSIALCIFAVAISDLKRYQSTWKCLQMCLKYLLGQGFTVLPVTSTVRIVLTSWIIVSLLLVTGFQSKLIADSYEKDAQIDTVDKLLKSNLSTSITLRYEALLDIKDNAVARHYYKDYVKCEIIDECIGRVALQKDSGTIASKRLLLYYINKHYKGKNNESLVYMFKESLRDYSNQFLITKGFPLKEAINNQILLMRSSGIIQRIIQEYDLINKRPLDLAEAQMHLGTHKLTLYELQGSFWILIAGWILSFVCFICEIVYNKYFLKIKHLINCIQPLK